MNRFLFSYLFLLLAACSPVRQVTLSDDELKTNLKRHITALSSAAYMGRETGTKGEELARNYIVTQFKDARLKPNGEKKFLQEFPFTEGAVMGRGSQLYVNTKSFKLNEDFYPLQYSGNGVAITYVARVGYGIYAHHLQHNDYDGKININKKIFVIESGYPDKTGRFRGYDLNQRVIYAISRGASAVVFINSDTTTESPKPDFIHKYSSLSVPVIFAKGEAARMLKNDLITNCAVGAEIQKIEKKGYNVIGYVNNKALTTVIIGAHYDHLGMNGQAEIYNGADDNASGVAALIELARYYNGKKNQKNNYLFIAFSGKEKGLWGSEYFIKHPTIDKKKINYMINLDMVGRAKVDAPALIINGTGTSSSWKTAIDIAGTNGLNIVTTNSDAVSSDQSSFCADSIPVLHFFTDFHDDFHNPTDDENKINYDGEVKIIYTVQQIIERLNNKGKLPFVKTQY